ncbi:MAG: methionyl-tRNA formyltransferase [Bacteroidota bacterium]
MRIIFMGTPEFAIPSLKILLENQYEVMAAVTAPDKPRGRGQRLSSPPVKEFASKHSLAVFQPLSLKDKEFVNQIVQLSPDLIAVVAFRILPREVFEIPRYGSFNLHASLLPKYRGAAPINWAIIKGEKETGVTTFLLQEKVDTGSIILQARVKIGEDETAGELHDRLAAVGAEIVLQTVRLIELGKAKPHAQDESLASPAPKIHREMCRIDWAKTAQEVHNFVRGLSPDPCAFTFHNGKLLNIYRTKKTGVKVHEASPGLVVSKTDKELQVVTEDEALAIEELQQGGKKRMQIEEFLRGYRLDRGDRLG